MYKLKNMLFRFMKGPFVPMNLVYPLSWTRMSIISIITVLYVDSSRLESPSDNASCSKLFIKKLVQFIIGLYNK